MDLDDRDSGTAIACVVCDRTILVFGDNVTAEKKSLQDLKEAVQWFRVTTCQPCRGSILETPESTRSGPILLPGLGLPVSRQAIENLQCYNVTCAWLGRRLNIYQLTGWGVIEHIYRMRDAMGDTLTVYKYDVYADRTFTNGAGGASFLISGQWKSTDVVSENTEVSKDDDACLGCVQCPAIRPLIRSQDPLLIWFRPTICRGCREAATSDRRLCAVGEVPIGGSFIEALPSFMAAAKRFGDELTFVKTQGLYVIESSWILMKQYGNEVLKPSSEADPATLTL